VLAARLASVRPSAGEALLVLAKAVLAAVIALAPAFVAAREAAPAAAQIGLGLAAPLVFVLVARRARILTPEDRDRLRSVLARRGVGPAVSWLVP
jgi:hypothetical protein